MASLKKLHTVPIDLEENILEYSHFEGYTEQYKIYRDISPAIRLNNWPGKTTINRISSDSILIESIPIPVAIIICNNSPQGDRKWWNEFGVYTCCLCVENGSRVYDLNLHNYTIGGEEMNLPIYRQ